METLSNVGHVNGFSVNRNGDGYYLWEDLSTPPQLKMFDSTGMSSQFLRQASKTVAGHKNLELGQFEQFQFLGWNDETVDSLKEMGELGIYLCGSLDAIAGTGDTTKLMRYWSSILGQQCRSCSM